MSQFQIYRNTHPTTQNTFPYLLDVQNNLLHDLRTTVVIPLMPMRLAKSHALSHLNPTLRIKSGDYAVMTQNLAGIDRSQLGEVVSDASQAQADILAALDFLVTGI